jgi:ribulose-5-phosphate 4-epimerase/fuculose-1-phosphate aldolase
MSTAGLIEDLVAANHILSQEGVVDGFGHVSVRHEKDPERFFLARSLAPANVRARDIMEFGMDGEPLNARGRKSYLERYIHSEIYRVRPDVVAIVHSHSPALIPFSVTGTTLRPIYHMSGFLGGTTPVFEIRDAGGPATDMLVRDRKLGAALAKSLGRSAFALMRGHGSVAVADSLKQVVYRAIYAEINARLQAEAMRLGTVTYLNDAEAAGASLTNAAAVERPWELWRSKVKGPSASSGAGGKRQSRRPK